MDHLKLAMPQSGTPKTGLVQFGDELPGIYITAEEAFALRLGLDEIEALSTNGFAAVDDDSSADEVRDAAEEVAFAGSQIAEKLAELRKLLALSPFGSVAHLQKMRGTKPAPFATAA